MNGPCRFDDRVVLITGAGGGLGSAYCRLFADRGARLVVHDLPGSPSTAEAVAAAVRAQGGEAIVSTADITTQDGARAVVAAAEGFGRLDAVVNNAGNLRDRTLLKMSEADLDDILTVHLRGTILVSQAALAVFKPAGYGRFVHTTSTAGLFGNFGQTAYASAKAGIAGFSRVLAAEAARYGVTSNVVAPLARTPMLGELLGPLGELLDPAQVAPLTGYLCSSACEVTGETFSVGGGRVARVVTGVTPGWFAGAGAAITVEDIADHFDEVRDIEDLTFPTSADDEVMLLAGLLGALPR